MKGQYIADNVRVKLANYLEVGVESLDLTPTMYKEVTAHYKALAGYLGDKGIDASFEPFGSLATGTVVRPGVGDEDDYFDLDIACKRLDVAPGAETYASVRGEVEESLENNGKYAGRLEICNECVTLSYVSDDLKDGCKLDLVVCVPNPSASGTGIKIAVKPSGWKESDPKALVEWFLKANQPFLEYDNSRARQRAYLRSKGVFASVEEVPVSMAKTALQRAIQFLKRSRNIFSARVADRQVVSSCALLVMVTRSAEKLNPGAGILDVIEAFIESAGSFNESPFLREKKWMLSNPATGENLLEEWQSEDAELFYLWLNAVKSDLMGSASPYRAIRDASFENLLGGRIAKQLAEKGGKAISVPTVMKAVVKPWVGLQ